MPQWSRKRTVETIRAAGFAGPIVVDMPAASLSVSDLRYFYPSLPRGSALANHVAFEIIKRPYPVDVDDKLRARMLLEHMKAFRRLIERPKDAQGQYDRATRGKLGESLVAMRRRELSYTQLPRAHRLLRVDAGEYGCDNEDCSEVKTVANL